MKDIYKEYTNGKVTVVWKPAKCIHSALCISGLSAVFDLDQTPWINMNGADSAQIIDQVNNCPSGALTCFENDEN